MPNQIDIGFTGEKNFRNVEIDMTKWMMRMPNGYPSIVHIRPGEKTSDAYIAVTTFENNILTWIVSDADLGPKEGIGLAQIWLEETQNDSVVKRGKSIKVATQIHGAINDASATPPTGQEAFLEQVNTLKNAAVAAAQSAYEYKEDALDAKDAAESAVNDAVSAKDDAVDAKDAAESAQGNAEAAQTAAETAQGLAEAAQAAAEGAQEAAETAQGLAENAQAAAEDAQEAAEAAQEGAEAAILHAPIIEDDVWMVWDPDEEDYVSTGVTAEGVDGSSAYVHIKYAAAQPTQDSDMKNTADAWMGIYSGDSSTAPTTYTSYTWYKIKGDSGGDPTSIIDDTAGSGTTNKVWSADKSSSLLSAIHSLDESIAPVESTATATAAHAVGELFMMGETLMVALSAIAVGDTITTEGVTPNAAVTTLSAKMIKDVQVNGSSVLTNGVANVPKSSSSTYGVLKVLDSGLAFNSSDQLYIVKANSSNVKDGGHQQRPIVPYNQHESTFFGLAKAASADMASLSSVTVGQYPEAQRRAISNMIEPQFRKIAEVTTKNSQATVLINTDLNGDAFSLKEIVIDFNCTAASGSGSAGIKINTTSQPVTDETPVLVCNNFYYTSARKSTAHCWISGGRFFGASVTGETQWYTTISLQSNRNAMGLAQCNNIESIFIYSLNSFTFGDDSVITVYGR